MQYLKLLKVLLRKTIEVDSIPGNFNSFILIKSLESFPKIIHHHPKKNKNKKTQSSEDSDKNKISKEEKFRDLGTYTVLFEQPLSRISLYFFL